jgi:uncharacterized Tic20 family protein
MTSNPPQPGQARARSGRAPILPAPTLPGPVPSPGRPGPQPARVGEVKAAKVGYLGVIVLGPVIPLAIYAVGARRSPFLREHTAAAVNLSVTCLLYAVCCAIVAGLLALDIVVLGLVIGIVLGAALWLTMLRYLIRGVGAANRGEQDEVPGWLSARVVG